MTFTGDDGIDHASDCHLQSTSCRLEKLIQKAHNGPCKKGNRIRKYDDTFYNNNYE